MKSMELPKIGDIITFSGKWNLIAVPEGSGHMPHGIVTDIRPYGQLDHSALEDDMYFGTLAYPLSVDIYLNQNSNIYVVQWASNERHVVNSYRCINEEWFLNDVFIIISKA
tara:strand:+ start:1084 stop:1416 length:333 start_codon:yes stop_codon:yes gene_type:complete